MNRLGYSKLTLLTGFLALGAMLATTTYSSASATNEIRVAAPFAPNPKPSPKPPKVGGKVERWGASLHANKQTSRLRSKNKARPSGKAISSSKTQQTRGPARHRSTRPKTISPQPFRLNIGICGHPGGNAPHLIRCLPSLDEPDAVEQPNLPQTTTPTTALVIPMPRPQDVQWEEVLAESKNVAFPKLRVKVQPAGRTLINLETIVYTDESKISTATVTLLGFPVLVEATPTSYTWNFGDGTSMNTTTPGRPYPAKDITHKYMKKGGVHLTLTTHYVARFNVAGTGWQYIAGTVPITGPATALQVREAVPVLVEPGR
ncbi:PKD domain-containing protein [Kribbella sp. CA-294648]|uniref:PKD domain-containing protein n=1 Tax=Kribbella sp. CA-294648 TaxID=3239948 RepID=UPI003D9438F4